MEQHRLTPFHCHRGFMLIAVLVVTSIGLLFGAGALLLFRYQCEKRIDRQHELEKLYAVRSMLNYLRTAASDIPPEGQTFNYHTRSLHNIDVIAEPVAPVFPTNTISHFFMERNHFIAASMELKTGPDRIRGWDPQRDFEYGQIGTTNLGIYSSGSASTEYYPYGLSFPDLDSSTYVDSNGMTKNVKWWVNIGMRDTGGWLQEEYGRRYFFRLQDCIGSGSGGTRDLIRLCIIRNVTNESEDVVFQHGWPLLNDEMALVFESSPVKGSPNRGMKFKEYRCVGGNVTEETLLEFPNCPTEHRTMGIQIAGKKVSIFYADDFLEKGYMFSRTCDMHDDMYKYFERGATRIDKKIISAPELRAVFEVEAYSAVRGSVGPGSPDDDAGRTDYVTNFRVTPAYQWDVSLGVNGITNLATVAQKVLLDDLPVDPTESGNNRIVTYDTHGTGSKGYPK